MNLVTPKSMVDFSLPMRIRVLRLLLVPLKIGQPALSQPALSRQLSDELYIELYDQCFKHYQFPT
jgi:hypothetical protein